MVTSTISAARAKPACCVATPGLPSSCAIAIGNVVEPDRDKNDVAPNSPSDTAMERPVARRIAGVRMGMSIRAHVMNGDAPRVADAFLSDIGIARTAGSTARITSGRAMTAWMTGISHRSDRHAKGEVLNVMMRPMPSVAAEIKSGSENSARCAELLATNKPRGTQMQAAAVAHISEVKITDCVETDSAGNAPEKMERHAESETCPFTRTDL
jgi:hypothetical protein